MKKLVKTGYREKPADIHAANLSVLKERIKSKNIGGAYVFYGDEDYTKNHYFSLMCPPGQNRLLNVATVYGEDFTLSGFMEACNSEAAQTADMFQEREEDENENPSAFRILKLVKPELSSLTKKDEDSFLEALDDLGENAVVFWFNPGDSVNLSSGIYKKICERSLVVNFKREPVGSSVLVTWILRHFSKSKINADRSTAVYMCTNVGNDMTLLKNEIDKCIDYLRFENRDALTTEDIDFLCIKSSEAQVFDVSNFAFKGEFVKAASALKVLKEKNEEPIVIMSVFSSRVNELCAIELCMKNGMFMTDIAKKLGIHEYAVKTGLEILKVRSEHHEGKVGFTAYAAHMCAEYDERIKLSRTYGFELLEELVCRLAMFGRR